MLQRQVATKLEMDTPMLSKIERGERYARRDQVKALSMVYEVHEEDLLSLWLADKLYDIAKDEDLALKAIQVVEEKLNRDIKKREL